MLWSWVEFLLLVYMLLVCIRRLIRPELVNKDMELRSGILERLGLGSYKEEWSVFQIRLFMSIFIMLLLLRIYYRVIDIVQ